MNKSPNFDADLLRSVSSRRPVSRIEIGTHGISPTRLLPLRTAFYAGEIVREEVWFEQPIGPHWRAAYRLHLERPGTRRARFVIAEVRVLPAERHARPGEWRASVLGQRARCPRGGIPARVMNQVRSRATLAAVQRHVSNLRTRHGAAGVAAVLHHTDAPARPNTVRPRGRPPAHTCAFYRTFARQVVEIEQYRMDGRSTRRRLAREFHVTEQTIANWIRRCRQLKILAEARPGSRAAALSLKLSPSRGQTA